MRKKFLNKTIVFGLITLAFYFLFYPLSYWELRFTEYIRTNEINKHNLTHA